MDDFYFGGSKKSRKIKKKKEEKKRKNRLAKACGYVNKKLPRPLLSRNWQKLLKRHQLK